MDHRLIFQVGCTKRIFYGVQEATGLLDYDNILEIAKEVKPHMIIAGASAYSRDIDFENIQSNS